MFGCCLFSSCSTIRSSRKIEIRGKTTTTTTLSTCINTLVWKISRTDFYFYIVHSLISSISCFPWNMKRFSNLYNLWTDFRCGYDGLWIFGYFSNSYIGDFTGPFKLFRYLLQNYLSWEEIFFSMKLKLVCFSPVNFFSKVSHSVKCNEKIWSEISEKQRNRCWNFCIFVANRQKSWNGINTPNVSFSCDWIDLLLLHRSFHLFAP